VVPKLSKHQQQRTSGKRAAKSVTAGKKRFEPVRRGVGDISKRLVNEKKEAQETFLNIYWMRGIIVGEIFIIMCVEGRVMENQLRLCIQGTV
jgi:hypothetical protein